MKQRSLKMAVVLVGATMLAGCGSIMGRTTMQEGHTYYAGVHNDMARVSGAGNYDYDFMTRDRAFIDLPFSLLADTLYAPVDYFHGPYRGQSESADAPQKPR
ncbi:YceK/YidQ family lipoprotein [Edwardsiella piscicida]|uniref:YceK/YidQ family lipoprotein n=1 Tax=Edwardsiella piscicida TaxID=1263550 RepID=UPI001CF351A1|nr:YceK/YidQ family lipoprotein [Edwardsiella piscicida]UCQ32489.1 YceK/YidQ family lipoprotein [Edwardsiella piscicida]UCQ58808.1 YceK/YidQ family lipoprotein [Edwardsiella piscicida]